MVKGSRQSSSIDNSGALFLGLGPFFLLLRLATLWFGSIFIAIPLQATALHAPRFSSFSCPGENLGAVCRLGVDMDSCDESLAPFHDLQVLKCGAWLQWQMSLQHIRPVRVAHPFCIFLISPSLGGGEWAAFYSPAWRFMSTWSRGNAKSGSSIWRHLRGTVDNVGLTLNIHTAWWFWLQI